LSEPESRAGAALIRALHPRVSAGVESRFANILGLPLRAMQRYNGSVVSWQNLSYPGTTAFVDGPQTRSWWMAQTRGAGPDRSSRAVAWSPGRR